MPAPSSGSATPTTTSSTPAPAGLFPIGVAVTHAGTADATVRVRLSGVPVAAVGRRLGRQRVAQSGAGVVGEFQASWNATATKCRAELTGKERFQMAGVEKSLTGVSTC